VWRDVMRQTKGWLPDDEADALYELGLASPPGLPMVELGSYCGKSTVCLGAAARELDVTLFTVDHHRGSPEMAPGQDCHDPEVLDADGRHDTLPWLRATIAAADLEWWVVPVVGASARVGRLWGTKVGTLFIDAGHDARSIRDDVSAWAEKVSGRIVFHDATIPHIGDEVEFLVADGWTELPSVGCMRIVAR